MITTTTTIPKARTFAGSPEEIRNVRHFVGQCIEGSPVADDVVLLASELATNAVRHTASGVDGTFCVLVQAAQGSVRIEVHDLGSDSAPAIRHTSTPGESGAGLTLVDMIS